jgi:hypothetical protein
VLAEGDTFIKVLPNTAKYEQKESQDGLDQLRYGFKYQGGTLQHISFWRVQLHLILLLYKTDLLLINVSIEQKKKVVSLFGACQHYLSD